MSTNLPPNLKGTNTPIFALASAIILILGTLGMVLFAPSEKTGSPLVVSIVGLVLSTIPTLIAAGFAERASRDIRNGVLTHQVKKGTTQALDETGVTKVVQDSVDQNPVAIASLMALVQDVRDRQGTTPADNKTADAKDGN